MVNSIKTELGVGQSPASLPHWIREVVGLPEARVRTRLRGNNLHLLFECTPCPGAAVVLPRLLAAFADRPIEAFLPAGSPQVYRVMVYGREAAQTTPQWTESLDLSQIQRADVAPGQAASPPAMPSAADVVAASDHGDRIDTGSGLQPTRFPASESAAAASETAVSETAVSEAAVSEAAVDPVSSLALARQGHPVAIAHYLSETLNHLGIAIRARVETPGLETSGLETSGLETPASRSKPAPAENLMNAAQNPETQSSGSPGKLKRLTILCEAAYIPEPLQLVEALAQQLRELDLKGFREALVFGQVSGEAKPEWVLRVDLTPPERLLRQWARWGDVQAIVRLLNRALRPQGLQITALLKDVTLHLTCAAPPGTEPDQRTAIATLCPLLASFNPQGIHGAMIYGLPTAPAAAPEVAVRAETPLWVHWLDLPAAAHPGLAPATLMLAQQGNLEALTFLVNRLLNPQLDRMLTTGGIRVQMRQKGSVLHVMTDALNCPPQKQVAQAIGKFMRPLQLPGIEGIRVYGRKAGQKQPLWSQGLDFVVRGRLVPAATPEFAASDAYVGDLLTPAGPMVLHAEANAPGWSVMLRERFEAWRQQIQRSLVQSQIFVPLDLHLDLPRSKAAIAHAAQTTDVETEPRQRQAVAWVWGAIGLVLVVQSDWVLVRILQPADTRSSATKSLVRSSQTQTGQAQPSQTQPGQTLATAPKAFSLPKLSLRKTKGADGTTFNGTGFTKAAGLAGGQTDGSTVDAANADADTANVDPPSLAAPKSLVASPLLPKAAVQTPGAYPTFNSRQLDEKLALYQQFMAENGGAADVLVIGSSRALRGVDPAALRQALAAQGYAGVRVFNMGINGATAQVVDLVVRQMIPQEALPKVIIWADGARAFNSGRVDITFNAIAASPGFKALLAGKPPIPGTLTAQSKPAKPDAAAPSPVANAYGQFNQTLNDGLGRWFALYPQRDRLKAGLRDQLAAILPKSNNLSAGNLADATSPAASASDRPDTIGAVTIGTVANGNSANGNGSVLTATQDRVDINGFLPLPNRFNPVTYYQKYARVSGDFDSDYDGFGLRGLQFDALSALTQFTQERKIALVFVNLPLTNDYLDATRRRYEEQFQQAMLQQSAQLGFGFRDLGNALPTQNDFFSDPSHLNRYGGHEVSRRLAQDVMIPWAKTQ